MWLRSSLRKILAPPTYLQDFYVIERVFPTDIVPEADPILLEKKDLLDFQASLSNSKLLSSRFQGQIVPPNQPVKLFLSGLYAMLDPFYKSFYLILIFLFHLSRLHWTSTYKDESKA